MSSAQLTAFEYPSLYIGIAEFVLNGMLSHTKLGPVLREKERAGGFLCVADIRGNPRLVVQIGKCDRTKLAKYRELCQEKVTRLAQHPDHFLSRQSEDESKEMFPGAVRGIYHLYGFSGLPGHVDELLSMSVATRASDLARETALSILNGYPNKYAAGSETNYLDL